MKRQAPVAPKVIEVGQVWQLSDSTVHITLTGKTLVHYKRFKPGVVRAPVSLINKDALGQFLRENKAVLIQS